jgi:hypothetical protein
MGFRTSFQLAIVDFHEICTMLATGKLHLLAIITGFL